MDYIDFRRRIVSDRKFASKFVNCRTPQTLIAAAKLEGFSFTEEDMRHNTDLLPEELEAMSGGTLSKADFWFLNAEFWNAG